MRYNIIHIIGLELSVAQGTHFRRLPALDRKLQFSLFVTLKVKFQNQAKYIPSALPRTTI